MTVTTSSIHVVAIVFLATVHSLQALPLIWMHHNLLDRHYLGNSLRHNTYNNNNYMAKHHRQPMHLSDHLEMKHHEKHHAEPPKSTALLSDTLGEPVLWADPPEPIQVEESGQNRNENPEVVIPMDSNLDFNVEENLTDQMDAEKPDDSEEQLSDEDEEFLLEMLAEGLELEQNFKKLLKTRANESGHQHHKKSTDFKPNF